MKANKQLKKEYKQKKFRIAVFQIRNTANGKIFISSSINVDAIWNRIKVELKFGGHRNAILQQEWNGYGEEKFVFEILSEILQEDTGKVDYDKEVKQLEQMFIEELQPFTNKGYHSPKP